MTEEATGETTQVHRRGSLLVTVGGLGAGTALLALVLLLGGGAPRVLPQLPSASPFVLWLLALMPFVHLVLGTATVACGVLVGGWLAPATATVRPVACAWAAASLLHLVLLSLQLTGIGVPVAQMLSKPQATGVFLSLLVIGFIAYAGPTAPGTVAALAVVALLPPLLSGHVRTAPQPWLAGLALTAHVVCAAVWVGGVAALCWLTVRRRAGWAEAVPRLSRVAGWAVFGVAVSGATTALTRVQSWSDLGTGYGVVVLLKVAALALLVTVGAGQRRAARSATVGSRRALVARTVIELLLMVLTFALAAGLADTPPPV